MPPRSRLPRSRLRSRSPSRSPPPPPSGSRSVTLNANIFSFEQSQVYESNSRRLHVAAMQFLLPGRQIDVSWCRLCFVVLRH
eukprot:2342648-Rhodomonas_salina.1